MSKIYNQRTCLIKNEGEVKVTAQSIFDKESSNTKDSAFVWLYNIKIDNFTYNNIKLISGRWEVYDKYGKSELEDKVLIDNPCIIKADQSFECTNVIRLFSDSGLIQGKYFFLNMDSNEEFSIDIQTVSLDNGSEKRNWN
ncbi:MAG: ApaG domain [Candidatus Rickettsia vulgarisii]